MRYVKNKGKNILYLDGISVHFDDKSGAFTLYFYL